ncbi:trimeric intracellular cation channel family protein [Rhizobium deserti]|uniref:Trimeric intracellular cation channel family protein n=1 Tax=Rhizobium deserti TaxID=2547961 RepID=A0A4R5UI22_9HYPH|nr:trimeric intracellular cation channel family protein [Rhizobium deserti]TDK35630.1 trimeric intracellular cation channel family protein [Rhizobium deserti]
MSLLMILDYAGVALFAATGALAASRKQLDLIGFLFFAAVTGLGGGTVRDLVLGRTPVFWVLDPTYILICVTAGAFVFLTAHRVEWRYRLLIWLDAIGISAYSVLGAAKGLAVTGSPTIAIVTGGLTATFGGILRDLLANEASVLLRPEIYITAALAGAGAFTAANALDLPVYASSCIGAGVAFALRGGAIHYGWTLPRYKPRPGRHPDEAMKGRKRKKGR